jgi:hypothetical protein
VSSLTFRQAIHDLLQALPSQGIQALKQLFWSELNYDRANSPLQTRTWADSTVAHLADPPLLFATSGGDFHVIYCRLNGRLNLTTERQIVQKLLAEHPFGLFIFSDADQTHWHFVNVKFTNAKQVGSRRLFRRITIAPDEFLRTATERISMLDVATISHDLFGISALEIQRRHDEAFDVEKVTKDFFTAYRRIFKAAEDSINLDWSVEEEHLYTQRFFNRLMFLTFLERKGWLIFNGRRDYLRALFQDYVENDPDKSTNANFHRKRLNTLFFWGLNNPRERNELDQPKFQILRRQIGDVPYLNGGLFEQEVNDEGWFFPDAIVVQVLTELIYAFNFTVTESTPLDVEVAVDPEMLGKIFEELVTGRHETGSYYTPKTVVAFMCREALKGYLTSTLSQEALEAVNEFVDQTNPMLLKNPEAVLEVLRKVRACDPACGSGAYLVGLLHELLDLRAALFATRQIDALTVYERKLEIIQDCLYGVDKDEFAVNIARLRLWLSLIVDFEGATPPPLPNLNYKIEAGDSLTAPNPSAGLELGFRKQLVDKLVQAKLEFLTAHDARKLSLRTEIESLKSDIIQWSGRSANDESFDWLVEFPEVFVTQAATTTVTGAMAGLVNQAGGQMELVSVPRSKIGFDVVLANPPYVRADAQFKHIENEDERQQEIAKWQAYRVHLKASKIYQTLYEKWDLFIPFLERAYQLLCSNGQMVFIIPDAYNAAKYAKKSHDFFLQNSLVMRIDFCSEIDLFDAGVNNSILHCEKGTPPASHMPMRVRRWGKRAEFDDNEEKLKTFSQTEFSSALFRTDGQKEVMGEGYFTLDMICYISVGMVIHADERKKQGLFKAEDLVSDIRDEQHPKPYIEGKDITKWAFKKIRFLEYGTKRAPSMFRRPTFIELHEPSEKLMASRMCGDNITVTYDNSQYLSNHTVILFVPWYLLSGVINKSIRKTAEYRHQNPEGNREIIESLSSKFLLKYLLAIMNSNFSKQLLNKNRKSKTDIYPDDWKKLPIAPLSLAEQKPFIEKVDRILGEFSNHRFPLPPDAARRVKDLERELDQMVAKLYEA